MCWWNHTHWVCLIIKYIPTALSQSKVNLTVPSYDTCLQEPELNCSHIRSHNWSQTDDISLQSRRMLRQVLMDNKVMLFWRFLNKHQEQVFLNIPFRSETHSDFLHFTGNFRSTTLKNNPIYYFFNASKWHTCYIEQSHFHFKGCSHYPDS